MSKAPLSLYILSPFSCLVVGVLSNRGLELFNALGHADNLLLDRSFFGLEVSELLLQTGRLSTHLAIVARDFLVNSVQLVLESLARILAFHGQHVFERFLLRTQNLHFLLVRVKLLVQGAAEVHQRVKLALQMGRVVAASLGGAIILACAKSIRNSHLLRMVEVIILIINQQHLIKRLIHFYLASFFYFD